MINQYNQHSFTNSSASSPNCETHSIMKTAVIYARYSSDSQTEQSIEGQLRVCEEFAKKNNILILNTYIDRAMTGTNDKRPAFQQMMADSNNKQWNYVLVYKLDRFSRDKYETTIHKHTLQQNSIKLLSANEIIPDAPEGIIYESMIEAINQYYSLELAQKVKRGMRETRLKGFYQGGGLPYGYKVENRKIIIDEEKIEIVKMIYELYANGIYVNEIIEQLSSKGIYNKGKPFAENTVYGILKNEKYVGIYKCQNETFDNMYPQIITRELYEKVHCKLNKNHYGKRSVKATYLLKDKLICGYCGKPISAECGRARNGEKICYYKCKGRKRYNIDCPKTTMRKETLEKFIIDCIINILQNEETKDSMIKKIIETQKDLIKNQSSLKILQKEKQHAETQLNNVMNAVAQGIVNKTTNKFMIDLEDKIEDLETKILLEKSKLSYKISEEEIKMFYEEALTQEGLILINLLVNKIVMYNDKIEIHFNKPLKRSPITTDSLFYSQLRDLYQIVELKQIPTSVKTKIDYYV